MALERAYEAVVSKKAPAGTQSLIRAVGLLRQIAASNEPVDLAALTRRTGLARTTTHRLLSALESERLVSRGARGAYRIGPLAIALGARARASYDLIGLARPALEALARDADETATLEIVADGQMLIIDEVAGRHLMGSAPEVGTSWAFHATSSGKAVLAARAAVRRLEPLRGRLQRFAPGTITGKADLEAELNEIRDRGFAVAVDELEEGFSAVSAVVRDALEKPVAALSINAPTVRLDRARTARAGKLVLRAAARVSAALGSAAE